MIEHPPEQVLFQTKLEWIINISPGEFSDSKIVILKHSIGTYKNFP